MQTFFFLSSLGWKKRLGGRQMFYHHARQMVPRTMGHMFPKPPVSISSSKTFQEVEKTLTKLENLAPATDSGTASKALF